MVTFCGLGMYDFDIEVLVCTIEISQAKVDVKDVLWYGIMLITFRICTADSALDQCIVGGAQLLRVHNEEDHRQGFGLE